MYACSVHQTAGRKTHKVTGGAAFRVFNWLISLLQKWPALENCNLIWRNTQGWPVCQWPWCQDNTFFTQTNTFRDLDKYVLGFGQICFVIWRNPFVKKNPAQLTSDQCVALSGLAVSQANQVRQQQQVTRVSAFFPALCSHKSLSNFSSGSVSEIWPNVFVQSNWMYFPMAEVTILLDRIPMSQCATSMNNVLVCSSMFLLNKHTGSTFYFLSSIC